MKNLLHTLLWVLMLSSFQPLLAQNDSIRLNRIITDTIAGEDILYGKCSPDFLINSELTGESFLNEYDPYQPDPEILALLQEKIGVVEITIVMGSWCSDSREQVPRFFKLMDDVAYETGEINIICVDGDKKTDFVDTESMKIERVPTFIFSIDGIETGRIIETPLESLEADLLKILMQI